jgi:hypothetical protein
MFSNLFKKKESKKDFAEKTKAMIAMVALNGSSLPHIDQIEKHLAAQMDWEMTLDDIDINETVTMFNLNGEKIFYTLMPAPIPWQELEGPCSTAWYWPEATELMSKQTAHIIISILPNPSSNLSSIDKAILLSKVTAAILYNSNSIGVYWGTGTVVNSKDVFIEKIRQISKNNLPFELWIDLRLQRTENGNVRFFTTGMDAFGHMEFEIRDSKMSENEMFSFMYNIIAYLMENGPVIKDGDTIGGDENQRIKVRYGKSMWDKSKDVMIVEC